MTPNDNDLTSNADLIPTRRLRAKERAIFDRVRGEFVHLVPSDAEQLTQYAEAVIRYEEAAKETRKNPTVSTPVVNRATGNVTGEKIVRNPAFATLREATAQMNTLARRLMIDAHSAEKRQRLLTKKSRALVAAESQAADDAANTITEEQIQAKIEEQKAQGLAYDEEGLRTNAIWLLTVHEPDMRRWAAEGYDDSDLFVK